jgi:uncharacterized membrane protein (UPF0127 family)
MNPIGWIAMWLRGRASSPGPSTPDRRLQVKNPARATVLATRLEVADSGPKRNKGLLGRDGIVPGEGLWIVPCESVHTFFMRFPIDLVYLDRKNTIRKVRSAVGPWRLSACFSAHSVIELPAGTIRNTLTECGDLLEFSPVQSPADIAGEDASRA